MQYWAPEVVQRLQLSPFDKKNYSIYNIQNFKRSCLTNLISGSVLKISSNEAKMDYARRVRVLRGLVDHSCQIRTK